jgi:hypothetical protein
LKPKNLREALDKIQDMLFEPYGEQLWDVLVALRGPDSRNRKIKNATTAVIRSTAFPKNPCLTRSVFGEDTPQSADRRRQMFLKKEDFNHFREHVHDAFVALNLKLREDNSGRNH